MKNILTILLVFSLSSCQEEDSGGSPIPYEIYFQIVDASTSQDWFDTHPNYNPETVRLSIIVNSGEEVNLNTPLHQIDNRSIFGPASLHSGLSEERITYYLRFGNQNVDTLLRVAQRCSNCCSEGNYSGVSTLTYFYNGQQVEQLDFRIDTEGHPIYRLFNTNNSLTDSTYIMTFEK